MRPKITLLTPLPPELRTLERGERIGWFAEKLLYSINGYEQMGTIRTREADAALLTALLARDLRRRAPGTPGEEDDPFQSKLVDWLRETANGIEAGTFDALAFAEGAARVLTADDGLAASVVEPTGETPLGAAE